MVCHNTDLLLTALVGIACGSRISSPVMSSSLNPTGTARLSGLSHTAHDCMTDKEQRCIIECSRNGLAHPSNYRFHGAMSPILDCSPTIAAQLAATKEYTQLPSTPKIVIEVQHPRIAYNVLQDLVMYCDNKFAEARSAERYQSRPQMWFHRQTARELGIPVMVEVYESAMQRIKAKAEDLKKDKEGYEMVKTDDTSDETAMLDGNDDWVIVDG